MSKSVDINTKNVTGLTQFPYTHCFQVKNETLKMEISVESITKPSYALNQNWLTLCQHGAILEMQRIRIVINFA